MDPFIPETMQAAAIDRFGGPEVLQTRVLPVPKLEDKQVLIRLEAAGIGVWDPEVRSGEFEFGKKGFPKVLGNDGAGTVVAVGKRVERVDVGDRVYAYGHEGGFYAQYVAVEEDETAIVPPNLPTEEAGALGADGVTALTGLEEELELRAGETVMIFGASGGVGHLAVQLAKRIGARVLAVASGEDGVDLVRRLGADAAVDGRSGPDSVARAVRAFAPEGIDAALVLVSGDSLQQALGGVRKGGRVAYPNGVEPAPKAPDGIEVTAYDGVASREIFERLNTRIAAGPFHVELGRTYGLEDAAQAHRAVGEHHLGKLALRIHAH
ncbi:MAG: zinc-binding alcohol dehydrogenase family protein [Myxococcales bacterium]